MRQFGILVFLGVARANFDYFYFSANGTCPGIYFECNAPESICAHEAVLDKFYCCSGEDYPVCRNGPNICAAPNNRPSQTQIQCGSGDDAWCCLSETERCTQRTGQINVCHATEANIVANVSSLVLNQTFSSLSSANPSATAFTIDAAQLAAQATSSSSSSSSTSSSTSATSSSDPSAPADSAGNVDDTSSSGDLSNGAIAGIAIAAIAALALVIGVIIFLLRLRKRAQAAEAMAGSGGVGDKDSSSSPLPVSQQQYLPLNHAPPQHDSDGSLLSGGGGGGGEATAYATTYQKFAPAQGAQHTYVSELDTRREAQELGGEREAAELYG